MNRQFPRSPPVCILIGQMGRLGRHYDGSDSLSRLQLCSSPPPDRRGHATHSHSKSAVSSREREGAPSDTGFLLPVVLTVLLSATSSPSTLFSTTRVGCESAAGCTAWNNSAIGPSPPVFPRTVGPSSGRPHTACATHNRLHGWRNPIVESSKVRGRF